MANLFHKVPVDIPNKSGFDMSHSNYFTAKCGTLVPALVEPLLPNDTINLDAFAQIQLPPMATDFYGDVDAKFEVFFVPYRLLYGGWQKVITRSESNRIENEILKYIPSLTAPSELLAPGSLADYLGVKIDISQAVTGQRDVTIPNILPFMAYHKIWSDWYRESRIQKDPFERPNPINGGVSFLSVSGLPYGEVALENGPYSIYADSDPYSEAQSQEGFFADEVRITSLRQRNWSKDYFTNATPRPQSGRESSIQFSVDGETGTGSFTISALRAANSLQRYMERLNVAGFRYADQIKAMYGVYPSDAVLDRSVYLGSHTIPIITKSVFQQNQTDEGFNGSTVNPFTSVGTKFGSAQGFDQSGLVDNFTTTEHGFLFVMFSIVPRAKYSSGTRRYLSESSQADIPNPLLQGVGDQPIYDYELTAEAFRTDDNQAIFGYSQRYAHYKFHPDEVHGLLRDGQNLAPFSLQRSFSTVESTQLGSDFLEIPIDYMDQVTAVNADMSQYGAWVQCGFKFHKSSTLSAYDIPTLGDMKNVHTELIDNGGRRL